MNDTQGHDAEHDKLSGLSRRRRPRSRRSGYVRPGRKRYLLIAIIFLVFAAAGAAGVYAIQHLHYALCVGGRPIVLLEDKRQAQQVLDILQRQNAADVPAVVQFREGAVDIRPIRKSSLPIEPVNAALEIVQRNVTIVLAGEAIAINGKPKILLASVGDAQEALSRCEERALDGNSGVPTFKEYVEIVPYTYTVGQEKHPPIPAMTPAQAAAELTHVPRQQYYTVKKSDNLYVIGVAHRLTVEQLKTLNPGINPAAMQPGDQIRLPDILAPLTVVIKE